VARGKSRGGGGGQTPNSHLKKKDYARVAARKGKEETRGTFAKKDAASGKANGKKYTLKRPSRDRRKKRGGGQLGETENGHGKNMD